MPFPLLKQSCSAPASWECCATRLFDSHFEDDAATMAKGGSCALRKTPMNASRQCTAVKVKPHAKGRAQRWHRTGGGCVQAFTRRVTGYPRTGHNGIRGDDARLPGNVDVRPRSISDVCPTRRVSRSGARGTKYPWCGRKKLDKVQLNESIPYVGIENIKKAVCAGREKDWFGLSTR